MWEFNEEVVKNYRLAEAKDEAPVNEKYIYIYCHRKSNQSCACNHDSGQRIPCFDSWKFTTT